MKKKGDNDDDQQGELGDKAVEEALLSSRSLLPVAGTSKKKRESTAKGKKWPLKEKKMN